MGARRENGKSKIDTEIDEVHKYLDATEPGTDEYQRLLENLETLERMKRDKARGRHDLEKDRKFGGLGVNGVIGVAAVVVPLVQTVGMCAFNMRDGIATGDGWKFIPKPPRPKF